MTCYSPLCGFRSKTTGKVLTQWANDVGEYMEVPCGQCIGCKIDRSRSWAIRCVHEAQMHERNCFITLTYDNENLPADGSVDVVHFQKFMKRLRKRFSDQEIRFFHCGEYGEQNLRPHYHATLFGIDFHQDKVLWKKHRENLIYRSATLEKLWPFGFSSIGEVTFQSAGYVARYIMKKINGPDAVEHYESVCKETGEIHNLKPEYTTMSRCPGIGSSWFSQYHSDVYPADEVVLSNGKRFKPPRYYDLLLERKDPQMWEEIKTRREDFAKLHTSDNTTQRLADRKFCKEAQISRLHRGYENNDPESIHNL